jgi:hypothetical protein
MHQSFSSHSSAKLNQASDPSRLGKMCGVAVPLAPSRCFRQQSASTHRGTPNAVYSLSWQSNPGSDLCLEMHVPLKSPTDKLCLLRCSIPHSIPASTFVPRDAIHIDRHASCLFRSRAAANHALPCRDLLPCRSRAPALDKYAH